MSQYVSALSPGLHSGEVQVFWFPSLLPEVGGLWRPDVVFPEGEVRNMDTWSVGGETVFCKAGPAILR